MRAALRQIPARAPNREPSPSRAILQLALGLILAATTSGCEAESDDRAPEPRARSAPRATAQAPPRADGRPLNLVVITLDTTRADALGVYGQQRPTSPSIDHMARDGTLFANVLASSPLTLPSHASLFSGKHPYAHGVRSNAGFILADEQITLAEVLRGRGYRTAAEIAVDVLRPETRLDQGFERYRGPADPGVELKQVIAKGSLKKLTKQIRLGSDISAKGIEFLRANRDRRFFLWLHYFDAHQPYRIPEVHRKRIPDSRYHAAVSAQDEFVGRVLDEIERLGLRDRTLVILTADHGEGLGEHREDTHSYFVYDTTMRVPLIFWGAKAVARGRVHTSIVRTVDIMPTALELLGLPPLPDGQGVSLARLVTGQDQDLSLLAYGESFEAKAYFGLSPIRFVREGRWKYIHKVNPELYDIDADPQELDNLAAQRPEIADRLLARLETLLAEAPAPAADARTAIDAQTRAQLQALGYVGSQVMPSDFDERASLELSGEDPVAKADLLREIARAHAMIGNELYDEAMAALAPLVAEHPRNLYILTRVAEVHSGREDYRQAIAAYRRVLAIEPCDEVAQSELNRLWRLLGDAEGLVAALRDGAEACPTFAGNLNNYAWALATLPRDDLRDGDAAVSAARAALELTSGRDPGFLDTLAAALAESGRFEEAVATQSDALREARAAEMPRALVAALEEHLEAFQAGRPIRSP